MIGEHTFQAEWDKEDSKNLDKFDSKDINAIKDNCLSMFIFGLTNKETFVEMFSSKASLITYDFLLIRYSKDFKSLLKKYYEKGQERNRAIKEHKL